MFKVGDKVKIIKDVSCIPESHLGKVGKIIEIESPMSGCYYYVKSSEMQEEWGFMEEELELIGLLALEMVSSPCPRCGGELEEKEIVISLFSNEITKINKCKNCGWC